MFETSVTYQNLEPISQYTEISVWQKNEVSFVKTIEDKRSSAFPGGEISLTLSKICKICCLSSGVASE
jgi:hypothetical protein